MAGRKRKPAADENAPKKPPKRSRKSHKAGVVVINSEDEEDFDAILARIKEQEESEQLARKLQEEWNGTSSAGPSAVVNRSTENDEAMARELAQQWEDGDYQPSSSKILQTQGSDNSVVGEPTTTQQFQGFKANLATHELDIESLKPSGEVESKIQLPKSSSYSIPMEDDPPDQKLAEFRSLFTRTRECTKCHKDVKSPRGHVSICHPIYDTPC